MTFPRGETLRMVERTAASSGAEAHIIDTGGFTRSAEQVQDYVGHMREVTYVLCPRGIENFSFRFFEALKFGRVPVLIDTDVVLPEGTNWDELMVRVPYSRLPEISDIVAEDHRNRTAADFIARQQLGLRTISDLEGGSWVGGLIDDVRRRLAAKSSRNNAKVLDS
jgi:hypothetical protein